MGLLGKAGAIARGEVSTRGLDAFASGNSDAYDLLDAVPAHGSARLAAWCAFVLQTHADRLIASGASPGYCSQGAFTDASMLYQLAGRWLDRARRAQALPALALDAVVPQPYPRPRGQLGENELTALRKTLETVQARFGADLAERAGDPLSLRLQPTLPALESALDSSEAMLAGGNVRPELLATMAHTLYVALDQAFQAGQLLALPELLYTAKPAPTADPVPVSRAAGLMLFLPGDPSFDPWCLTDPIDVSVRFEDGASRRQLHALWKADPEPAKTLAIQAEIVGLIECGAADYLPGGHFGSLAMVHELCPWPGVLLVKAACSVSGQPLDAGDRIVLAVGGSADTFRRTVIRVSPKAAEAL